MPSELEDAYAEKHSIVSELFIKTADDNYVAARWCFQQGLDVDFLWLAVHSLEKYLKACLLLNEKPAKKHGHDVIKLYADVRSLAPELLPDEMKQPCAIRDGLWRSETVPDFFDRLYRNGEPNNRYQLFGYSLSTDDLWKIDQVVFRVRRLCRRLDAYELGRRHEGAANLSNREALGQPLVTRWRLQSKLEEIMSGARGPQLLHVFLNNNFAFAPEDYPHTDEGYRASSSNPVLIRRIYDPLREGQKYFEAADDLWNWIKINISLPQDLILEIENERARLKADYARETPVQHRIIGNAPI